MPSDRSKRELRLGVLLCLLGSALVLLAASRAWVTFTEEQGLTIRRATSGVSGSQIVPGARALGLVGLAGVVALAATRRWGRLLVGALVFTAGLGVVVVVARAMTDLTSRAQVVAAQPGGAGVVVAQPGGAGGGVLGGGTTHLAWPSLCLAGGVVLALAGLLVAVRGRRWAALSAAYEPPLPSASIAPPVATSTAATPVATSSAAAPVATPTAAGPTSSTPPASGSAATSAAAPNASAPGSPAPGSSPLGAVAPASLPPAASPVGEKALWEALDRGEDPTA